MDAQLSVKTKNLQHLCRTCTSKTFGSKQLQERDVAQLQPIYELVSIKPSDSNENLRIIELLNNTVPKLCIKMTDSLPKNICNECLTRILQIHEFQQMCIESDKILHQLCLEKKFQVENDLSDDSSDGSKNEILKPFKHDFIESETNDSCDQYDKADILKIIVGEPDVKSVVSNSLTPEGKESPLTRHNDDSKSEGTSLRRDQRLRSFFKGTTQEELKILHTNSINVPLPTEKESQLQKVNEFEQNIKAEEATRKPQTFKCTICSKIFGNNRYLKKHLKRHLNGGIIKNEAQTTKQHVCQYCNKAFQQSCTLKDHLRTHTGEQPYLCSECGKAFKCSSNLRQHLLRHSGEKRYECPVCPKKFPCLTDLASHKAVHLKIKPHVCDVCKAAFGKPCQLKKHKMYHNNEKPHKCEYCSMRFVCSDHMRRHMRTHTGEKPYKCKYCERAFVQSNDLIKHLRLHLGENVYKCELCPATFRLASELRTHFAEHKNDSQEMREKNLKALKEYDEALKQRLISTSCTKRKPSVNSILEK